MEIINGQLHSESIARVSVSEVGDAREVITMGAGWGYWNGNSADGGLPFGSEGTSSIGEVLFNDCTGNSVTWDALVGWGEG